MSETEIRPGICGVCPGGCAVNLTLQDGVLKKIRPLTDSPFGTICPRGLKGAEVLYSPDRLKSPLIRIGERGEGKFRKASWDEALDLITSELNRLKDHYGPQSIISHSGRGAFEQSLIDFNNLSVDMVSSKLLWLLGSPNISSVGSLCYTSYGVLAPMPTLGLLAAQIDSEFEKSDLIIVWGANPVTDSPPFLFKRICKAKAAGAKLIAIDQMRSDIAKRADQWIPIRSGTDGALALGLLHVIINENLYNHAFVSKWTYGFDELAEYVQEFTPAKVESITSVPTSVIETLARELATTEKVSLRTYTGLEYANSGVQSIRAVFILWAITGKLDAPGGLYIQIPKASLGVMAEIRKPEGVLPIGADKYPIYHKYIGSAHFLEFPNAVLKGEPYPIKGLIINGASVTTSYPQTEVWEEAFRALEFMVTIDRFLTRDALFADVVLPATTFFENRSYQRYPGYFRLRERVVEPIGEARNDLLIIAAIAEKLGLGEYYPQSEDELLQKAFTHQPELLERLLASPKGVAIPLPEKQYHKYERGLLRPDGAPGFNTPTGKLEIWSTVFEEYGYDALPKYVEPVEGPENAQLAQDYPLILNTGARIQSTFRSQHLNIPALWQRQPKPLVLINPADAQIRHIQDGDEVRISTPRGSVIYWAKVTQDVMPGSVEANMGGGSPMQNEFWRKANINYLTCWQNRDPISGFPIFKALLCQIEKAVANE